MASAFGAGSGADMLQEVLRRKLVEQAQFAQQRQNAMQLAETAAYHDAELGARNRTEQRIAAEQQAADAARAQAAAAQRNEGVLRGAMQGSFNAQGTADPMGAKATRDALRVAMASGGAKANEIPQEPVPAKPQLYAITVPGPKGEPIHKLVTQDQLEGGMQEYRAPVQSGPTHPRFNITQGADADGKPAFIRTNVDTGQIEVLPVPAGANFVKRDQPATADQTNLAIYSSRIAQAEPSLKALENNIAAMNPASFLIQSKVDNPYVQTAEMQKYSQAARQFVNSVLRRESGAAISQSEFDSARKQYLPMPGDTPETLAMKAAARADVIQQFTKGAGPAAQKPSHPSGGGDSASKAAELLKKYGGG